MTGVQTCALPISEEWIPYYNLQCGDLLKRFIEDQDQDGHWIRDAISDTPLLIRGSQEEQHVAEINSGIRFQYEIAPTNLETNLDQNDSTVREVEEGKVNESTKF